MKYLKFSLFALCFAVIATIVASIIQIPLIYGFSVIGGCVSVGSLIVWLCSKISKRFNHSTNVIVIIAFVAAGIYSYIFAPSEIKITNITDIYNLDIFSIAVIVSILGASISLLVLLWKLIFANKIEVTEDSTTGGEKNNGNWKPQDGEVCSK